MNLIELYEQTPVETHLRIKVRGDQVYIIDEDGDANLEYLIDGDGELIPLYSEKKLKADIKAIRKKLNVARPLPIRK